ncbi:hypothetical protein [Dactylosporangium sp. CA-139066]|uniref:hypothetical protein n=1 Tax=Dactylosporangium sp. CA-139066 TaxID=3239930 RepID=UPI003D91E1CC
MSHRCLPTAVVSAAVLALAGCGGGAKPAAAPSPERASADVLLAPADLPDGYTVSPADVAPEVSTASSASVAGCDALLDYFRDGGGAMQGQIARFEAGGTGPFLAEEVSAGSEAAELAARCASFTDTDGGGETTAVSVAPVGDFPRLGEQERVFRMSANGGTGDDAFALSGYLVVVRVGPATCTLVHFGQPGVDRAETETIARAAVSKIRRRQ